MVSLEHTQAPLSPSSRVVLFTLQKTSHQAPYGGVTEAAIDKDDLLPVFSDEGILLFKEHRHLRKGAFCHAPLSPWHALLLLLSIALLSFYQALLGHAASLI